MAKLNLSTILAATLCGWAFLWPLGWAFSWSTWWAVSAAAFFLGTSLLFGWSFFRVPCPDSDR
jgi:hypothetical protein